MGTAAGSWIEPDIRKPLLHRIEVWLRFGMVAIIVVPGQRSLGHGFLDSRHAGDLSQVNLLGRLFDDPRWSTATSHYTHCG